MSEEKYNLRYLTQIAMVAALGGLLFGYDWVVIGGAKPFYEPFFGIAGSPLLQGWAISSALVGCMAGAVLSGLISDRYGRKNVLIMAAALFLISAIGTGLANTFSIFIFYRIVGGVGIGLASTASPVYIAEVSPAPIRGRFVSINQLTIVIGILLAQIINWLIAEEVPANATGQEILASWNGQTGWRWMFWAEAVPAALFFGLMWAVPESPRWLVKARQPQKAKTILAKVGGAAYADRAARDIEETLKAQHGKTNLFAALRQKPVRAILALGVFLAVLQQWCGINVIFMYAEEVFTAAGYSLSDMLFNIVITGSVNLIFTFAAMALVDKIGRKPLMLIGLGGLSAIYLLVGLFYSMQVSGWPVLLLIVLAIACYAMTLAPVTWVILSEIFPNQIRGAAMAIATFALWVGNALLAYFFPIINQAINASGSFWVFAGICIAGLIFVWFRLPETKGKTLEEIELHV
ncbi:MAG: sugar porter family MFS transporter [Haliscomenobacter sp.]|nr:sugar porter family MFS transporter [Haliscomenobacter sp.]MBP9077479.1 sugar porter family MFS transporter [Haliscomenobacter sp.]